VGELIQGLVPLFVRVDPGDVRVLAEVKNAHFGCAAITIYDQVPDGVGLSERIFRSLQEVLRAALGLIERCPCRTGCPSCIGPAADRGLAGKPAAAVLLAGLVRGEAPARAPRCEAGEGA
jgi:DEAD/DEAH box helicase domain-containing protein